MSSEALTAVKISLLVVCIAGSSDPYKLSTTYFSPDERGSMFLRNVVINVQVHTTLQLIQVNIKIPDVD
jgi:hypothetical protein